MIAGACGSSRKADTTSESSSSTTSAAAGGSFGTLGEVCGKGTAKGATDQGVTDSAIKIGFGDDAGYAAAPGLNHEMGDAVKAFVKWCNDAGGINGRQIDATYYDGKITEVNNAWTEACPKEFFMVGEGFALDAAQEQVRRGCKLPAVAGYAVSPQFANAPLKFEPSPVPADYTEVSGLAQLAKMFPDKIKKAAAVFANYSATIDSKDKVVNATPSLGYSWSCPQTYNIAGEADWKPFAQKLKDCGIQFVYFVGSPYPNFENFITSAAQLDYKPVFYTDPNFYDTNLAKWNTSGFGDSLYFRKSYVPLKAASYPKGTEHYLDILKKYGGDVNQLGEQAASAFLLWATAAKACGATLTRQCVLDKISAQHEWTGGGMHAAADPGANKPTQCGMLMNLKGTKFVRVTPTKPAEYDCNAAYAAKVTGPELERAKLDANRISQL